MALKVGQECGSGSSTSQIIQILCLPQLYSCEQTIHAWLVDLKTTTTKPTRKNIGTTKQ